MPDPEPVGPVVRGHLEALGSPLGIYQHARGAAPDPAHGTCSDDVARALGVDLLHAEVIGWPAVAGSVERNVRYLVRALEAGGGWFRNQRAADGAWHEEPPSEDCQGRSMLALAEAAVTIPEPTLRSVAAIAFERSLAIADDLRSLRGISWAILACATAHGASVAGGGHRGGDEATERDGDLALAHLARLARLLEAQFADVDVDGWPWPEPIVTYEGALPPRALIAAGRCLGRLDLVGRGLAVLDWLLGAEMGADGAFHPVGNGGWWPRDGLPARFDQQPIEAAATILAAEAAWRATDDPRYVAVAEAAFGWFLGRNDLRLALADPARGACHDGLEAEGVNANQGAESTLAWLTAVERMRAIRRRAATTGEPQPAPPSFVPADGRGQARTYARTSR